VPPSACSTSQIDVDLAFAEGRGDRCGAQRAADQALDLRTAVQAAGCRRRPTAGAFEGGALASCIFGRDPPRPPAPWQGWQPFFQRGREQAQGIAEFTRQEALGLF